MVQTLCQNCYHGHKIVSGKGSRFLLCQLSLTDHQFAKYPPQPVVRCGGFEEAKGENDSSQQKGNVNQMSRIKMASKLILAIFMVGAGVMHFVNPDFYLKIMPPYLPLHRELVYLSGVCEIVLGALLLIPRFSRLAAWGIIALLIAVFPANIYVYQNQDVLPASAIFHLLRLPLQGVFILWAYWHTKPK